MSASSPVGVVASPSFEVIASQATTISPLPVTGEDIPDDSAEVPLERYVNPRKATDIDAAVFDLKAVNPMAVVDVDTRTPQQIIENIEAQGRVVIDALAKLPALMAVAG